MYNKKKTKLLMKNFFLILHCQVKLKYLKIFLHYNNLWIRLMLLIMYNAPVHRFSYANKRILFWIMFHCMSCKMLLITSQTSHFRVIPFLKIKKIHSNKANALSSPTVYLLIYIEYEILLNGYTRRTFHILLSTVILNFIKNFPRVINWGFMQSNETSYSCR